MIYVDTHETTTTIKTINTCMFNFFKKLPSCFPKQFSHFTFPPAACESFSSSTPSRTLGMVSTLNFSCSNRYVAVFHPDLNRTSVITNAIEHLFMCLFTIYVTSWWSVCSNTLSIFIGFVIKFWELFIYTDYESFISNKYEQTILEI